MMARDAALERFGNLLEGIVLDNTDDEAMALWRHRVQLNPSGARTDVEALDAILADPPDDLADRMAKHGIHLFHIGATHGTPYTEAERVEWLRDLAARLRAAL
jgi:hypothetical protein